MRSIGLAAVSLQGFVDAIERGVVYGWAWNPQRPDDHVQVEILLGGRQLAVVTADQFRDDLVELEIGDGRHAFEYAIADQLAGRVDGSEVEVRYAGSSVPLPRMKVRPQRRLPADAPPRPAEEMIAALQERIALQEQVINDMSNLLRVMADRFRGMPAPAEGDGEPSPAGTGRVLAALEQQGQTLNSIETFLMTFGQTLREIADAGRVRERERRRVAGGFRAMDAVFLALLAGTVAGFVLAFGGFY